MSIHHLDCFRFLFGDPESVYVSARTDPRTQFPHRDGIVLYILEYANGMRASAWDDVWAGPAREGAAADFYIKWRVEGTDGLAQGTIGWPGYPNAVPSTIEFTTAGNPGRLDRSRVERGLVSRRVSGHHGRVAGQPDGASRNPPSAGVKTSARWRWWTPVTGRWTSIVR